MSSYGPCPFCDAHVMGWNATDGFHPRAHFCEPMVDSLQAELAEAVQVIKLFMDEYANRYGIDGAYDEPMERGRAFLARQEAK